MLPTDGNCCLAQSSISVWVYLNKPKRTKLGNAEKGLVAFNELNDFTSPAGTPTQIRSTAALFLPTYVCAEAGKQ